MSESKASKDASNENLKLWLSVEKTNPDYTKDTSRKNKQTGAILHKSTAINASYQMKNATALWGSYGSTWGLKNTAFDFALLDVTGLAMYKAIFYYPGGEFEISNTIAVRGGANQYVDKEFAKKVETDTLTKALSKLGFNSDIFMGEFDDENYVAERMAEVEMEKADDKEAALKAKMQEIKNLAKSECEMFARLPNEKTIQNYASKIFKKVRDKLKAYNFPPDTLDAFIENRTNEAIKALTENKDK